MQTRIGRDGVPFRMYKMRSMHTDAEARLAEFVAENEMDSPLFKIRRDPRVTRVGYLLRRSSLDELPQLFNVLRGEMSLVGPRPALPAEVATTSRRSMRRLAVCPASPGCGRSAGAPTSPGTRPCGSTCTTPTTGGSSTTWRSPLARSAAVMQARGAY